VSFGRGAFDEVYRQHAADVRRWVARFFRSPFEQEEAVQEVWLTVHRMLPRYDATKGPLAPWLRALSANRCREILRASARRPSSDVPIEDVSDALWLDAPGPEAQLHSSQVKKEVERFTATLSEEEAKVFKLCFAEQRTHPEVAAALGIDERRSKYLKQKVLAAAARDAGLTALRGGA
jgi:RNA polymerase sigma-70 factor (ECF subfamily)